MRILLIGDLHFKVGNKDETDGCCQAILEHLAENEYRFIVVLGDVLDTHEKIHVSPLMRATKFIHAISKYSQAFVLVGNHDRPNNSIFLTDESSLFHLKFLKNINLVYTTALTKDGFLFVPYVEPGRFMEALAVRNIDDKMLKSGEIKAIFAHQEFKGAQMGGIISLGGDEWKKEYPPVYSGHIHEYQELEDGVTYLGTPYQMGYADTSRKGIYSLEIKDDGGDLNYIDLGLKKKVLRKLTIKDLETFKLDPEVDEKLIIEGSAKEIRKILKEKKDLQGIKFSIKETEIQQKDVPKKGEVKTFSNLLEEIKKKSNPLQREILEEIFN
jgi:DNA repair exonuclease SbcCD nuclease subunit